MQQDRKIERSQVMISLRHYPVHIGTDAHPTARFLFCELTGDKGSVLSAASAGEHWNCRNCMLKGKSWNSRKIFDPEDFFFM